MTTLEQHLELISQVRTNPAAIQQHSLDRLEEAYNGSLQLSDATNPLIHLYEASACNSAAGIIETEALFRKQYASMAITADEIYNHMSDRDYVGRFATPSRAKFTFLFHRDEIYRRAVQETTSGIRKLTIPRNTNITLNEIKFTMQYPIDIRVMLHGGLQITYDNNIESPLQTLQSNIVEWDVVSLEDRDWVRIQVPMEQFEIISLPISGNLTGEIRKTFDYSGEYYHARVWDRRPNGEWRELKTTHSAQVFDPLTPTALLKVVDKKVTVTIPSVYTLNGLVSTSLRMDLYQTQGPLDLILSNFQAGYFVINWKDTLADKLDKFSLGAIHFDSYSAFADSTTAGGSYELPLLELRDRVQYNASGPSRAPISNIQLESAMNRRGYSVVKDLDYVTNRDYLATRELPPPSDGSTVAGIGATIQKFATTFQALANLETTSDNGNRITLLPDTLYEIKNGLVEIVPKILVDNIRMLSSDLRARRINDSQFLYTPFHYVLDMSNDRFEHRAYYMDSPVIESKSFVEDNETAGIAITATNWQIERVSEGYELYVLVQSDETWKQFPDHSVHAQLSFRPTGERDRAYQNGELVGTNDDGERLYRFRLHTGFDLDEQNQLVLNSFRMYSDPERPHKTSLTNEFDIVFAVTGIQSNVIQASAIDDMLGVALLPENTVGINRERFKITLGKALSGLWSSSRTTVTEEDYRRYPNDVIATYEQDVYDRDPITGAIKWIEDGNGGVEFVKLHSKGDTVLDAVGQPVIKFRAGDVVLDHTGMPEVLSTRSLLRQIDLLFFDGAYYFSDYTPTLAYSLEAPRTIVDWLTQDIEPFKAQMLEQTNLYFHPKASMGLVPVIIGEEKETYIRSQQSFEVTFYVTGTVYRNAELRAALTRTTTEVIDDCLRQQVVTINDIYKRITEVVGEDVIGLDLKGLGGLDPQTAITVRDDSARLSIRKRAVQMPDRTIGVEDDVAVSFIQHVIR